MDRPTAAEAKIIRSTFLRSSSSDALTNILDDEQQTIEEMFFLTTSSEAIDESAENEATYPDPIAN